MIRRVAIWSAALSCAACSLAPLSNVYDAGGGTVDASIAPPWDASIPIIPGDDQPTPQGVFAPGPQAAIDAVVQLRLEIKPGQRWLIIATGLIASEHPLGRAHLRRDDALIAEVGPHGEPGSRAGFSMVDLLQSAGTYTWTVGGQDAELSQVRLTAAPLPTQARTIMAPEVEATGEGVELLSLELEDPDPHLVLATAIARAEPRSATPSMTWLSIDGEGSSPQHNPSDSPQSALFVAAPQGAQQVRLLGTSSSGALDEPGWSSIYDHFALPLSVVGALPEGHPAQVVINHSALVQEGIARPDGAGMRLGFFDGDTWSELPRALDDDARWGQEAVGLWFKLPMDFDPARHQLSLFFAGTDLDDPRPEPLSDPQTVFRLYDTFDAPALDESRWLLQGNAQPFGGSLELRGRITGALALVQGHRLEARLRLARPSVLANDRYLSMVSEPDSASQVLGMGRLFEAHYGQVQNDEAELGVADTATISRVFALDWINDRARFFIDGEERGALPYEEAPSPLLPALGEPLTLRTTRVEWARVRPILEDPPQVLPGTLISRAGAQRGRWSNLMVIALPLSAFDAHQVHIEAPSETTNSAQPTLLAEAESQSAPQLAIALMQISAQQPGIAQAAITLGPDRLETSAFAAQPRADHIAAVVAPLDGRDLCTLELTSPDGQPLRAERTAIVFLSYGAR